MKIVKFLSVDEKELYGILDPLRPDEARVIEGNLFEEIKLTEKIVHIKSILPPIFPPNIFALGLNYREHADETGIDYPEVPVVFLKGTNTITGHGSPIILPEAGPNEVDYEAELAVVIGKKAKNVSPEDAGKYIFGYMCANDVSARDWQMLKQKQQWARGKSSDRPLSRNERRNRKPSQSSHKAVFKRRSNAGFKHVEYAFRYFCHN
jgi:2-keto-4-pentenoate hydratase/2-oxohepta-3-ene-1,7-dioic acid hydratase in catechol pathway